MSTADKYCVEVSIHVRTITVGEHHLSPVRTERLVSSAPTGPHLPLSALYEIFATPAHVYAQVLAEPTVPEPVVPIISKTLVYDSAPHEPPIVVQTADPSLVGSTAVMHPLPLALEILGIGMVPFHIHYTLFNNISGCRVAMESYLLP